MDKFCLNCKELLKGRVDKKFCNPYCKSAYHYDLKKHTEDSLFVKIDKQLKENRRILKKYNQGGLVTIRKQKIKQEGFDANYFTHYWKNNKGQIYLFCYEFGFLSINQKYVLVTWQPYMKMD